MRMTSSARTEALLDIALAQAAAVGWRVLTHDDVARSAGVSRGLVVARLGTKTQMLRSIMRAAVAKRVVAVVAEGLLVRDKHALKAPEDLKAAAVAWVGAGA